MSAVPAYQTDAEKARAKSRLEQQRASDPRVFAWASAHAGTGKTKVLVDRMIRLLLEGVAPHRILCITFTKSATSEMANRLHRELAGWATMDDNTLRTSLERLTGSVPNGDDLHRARRLFAAVLDAPGGLAIHTIHGFCQSVLKRFPVEAEVAPHFAVIDERDAVAARDEARRAVIEAARDGRGGGRELAESLAVVNTFAGEDQFETLLDEMMSRPVRLRAALTDGFEPFLDRLYSSLGIVRGDSESTILAAASNSGPEIETGLKRVATAMLKGSETDREIGGCIVNWLAAVDRIAADFDSYLGCFFTKESTGDRRIGWGERRNRLITAEATKLELQGAAILAAEADRLDTIREQLRAARTAAATQAVFRLSFAVLDRYERYKAEQAALDFDDLIERTLALIDTAGPSWVMFKLDGGIDHVLVDEAQDTSAEQWRLIAKLVEEFFSGEGRVREAIERTLFVVGDFKQSIYRFQGAAPEQFLAMHRALREQARNAKRTWRDVTLDVSFRATEGVLEAIDRIFARPETAQGVIERGVSLRQMSARAGLAAIVELWPTVKPDEPSGDGALVPAAPARPPLEPSAMLANEIARRIANWLDSGEELESRGRAFTAGDVMILVRRRGVRRGGAFMQQMVRALKERRLPVAGVDRMRLTEQLAVKDLSALGDILLLPDDDLTLATVLKGPIIGMNDDDHLFPLAYGRGTQTLWNRLAAAAAERGGLFAAAHSRLASLRERTDFVPPYELYAALLEAEGGRRAMLSRLGPDAEDPIDEFLDLAIDYQRRHAPSLTGFLHWLRRGETEIARDLEHSGRDEVRVLTVHGAKGLEAPIVFLADTTTLPPDGDRILWPIDQVEAPLFAARRSDETRAASTRRALQRERDLDEYRRLLYVALTRAADRLYVCGYENRNGRGQGCWYDLTAAALAGEGAGARQIPFEGPWQGSAWRIDRRGRGAEPMRTRRAAVRPAARPEWLERAPPAEPLPSRPLAPSRPIDEDPAVRSPIDARDGGRFRRGTVIHRLLETIPLVPTAARAETVRRFLRRPDRGLSEEAAKSIARETLNLLDDPQCAALFGPDSVAEVPIAGVAGRIVVAGQIDRLVVTADHVLLVDYKSNRAPPPRADDVPRAYMRQMAAYRLLLRQIYPQRTIRFFLLWTEVPMLMELSDAALDAVPLAASP